MDNANPGIPGEDSQIVARLLADLFEITAIYRQGLSSLAFSLNYRFERERSLKLLEDRLKTAGYHYSLDENPDGLILTVDPRPRRRIPPLNIVLFALTLVSIYFVSVYYRYLLISDGFADAIGPTLAALGRGEGIEFTTAMISILFVHEMGHYLASRRRHIVTSWPYFIPAPNLIGTFGAIIKSKSPFWNRRDLIEVGAAGPIAGWIVAVACLWYGLSQSAVLPPEAFAPTDLAFQMDGESILMRLSTALFLGDAPAGHFYRLSEAAFAGWVGLLITAINLLPIGQLDGGHIVYGLIRRRQHLLGKLAVGGLLLLGMQSPMWWFFAAFGLLFGMSHPPTLDDSRELSNNSRLMGWIALGILVVSFTPIPFR